MSRQEWAYTKGRVQMEVSFLTPKGRRVTKPLLVNTGCPYQFILSENNIDNLGLRKAPDLTIKPWGKLEGAWVHLSMPNLGIDEYLIAYGNQELVKVAHQADLEGVVGLPFLRKYKYGGNQQKFWLEV